jgi:hypothetical protein
MLMINSNITLSVKSRNVARWMDDYRFRDKRDQAFAESCLQQHRPSHLIDGLHAMLTKVLFSWHPGNGLHLQVPGKKTLKLVVE